MIRKVGWPNVFFICLKYKMKINDSMFVIILIGLISIQMSSLFGQCKTKLTEDQKIESLIQAVASLDGKFIRNGEEHNADEAASHLRLKLSNAKKSLFSSGKNWTAHQFIDQLATKSSLSGIPYEIKLKNGKSYPSSEWLKKELNKLSEGCPSD